MYIRRRSFVLILSFALFATAITGGFLFCEAKKNASLVSDNGYGYQRDIANLAVSLDEISRGLQKAKYAQTPYRSAAIAAKLLAEAESARTALSALPTYELMLEKTNEFLSRVGDYSMYLTRKAINGETVTAEEMANLNSLARSAAILADKMAEIEASVIGENMDYDTISDMFDVPDEYWEQSIETSSGGLSETEAPNDFLGFEEIFPSDEFNYDGLYSDHLKTVTSPFLDSLEAITEKEAKEKAAAILGCPVEELSVTGDVGTTSMKCYVFTRGQDRATVYLTKQGGYLYSYSSNGGATMGDISVDEDTAVASAEEFLAKCGYSNCGRAYWQYQDNLIMLTYVTINNGVRIYPEEIKVGVSLTDGQVVYCDASRHLISKNSSRDLDLEGGITEEEAVATISSLLETENVEKAVIQTPGNRDILCYEIYCKSDDTEMVVYINAQTGAEEESLLLTSNEEGYWAK